MVALFCSEMVCGGFWGLWWFLVILSGFGGCGCLWWFVVICGGFW